MYQKLYHLLFITTVVLSLLPYAHQATQILSSVWRPSRCLPDNFTYQTSLAAYTQTGNSYPNPFWNQSCTIRPRWVNVNVTYVRGGFVTLELMPQKLPDMPLNLSNIIQSTTLTLDDHFYSSQTPTANNIVDSINDVAKLMASLSRNEDSSQTEESSWTEAALVSTHYTLAPSH